MDGGAVDEEAGSGDSGGDVVVTLVGEGLDFVGSGFDGGGFDVGVEIGGVGFDEADVIEEEFIAAACSEDSFFKEDADFGGGPVLVVGEDFDDDGDFMGGVAFKGDLIEDEFLIAGAGSFFDRPLDAFAGDALFFGFFDGGVEPGIRGWIGSAVFGGDGDFAEEFPRIL